eukprot:SM000041S15429  [mRNA]  locus=s41:73206:74812:+ [translate_table: standard]
MASPDSGSAATSISVTASLQDVTVALQEVVKHVLYMHNQIPRRCLKLLKDADQLLLALQRALADVHDMRTMLLILGPSLLRPKVAYVITIDLHLKAAESDAQQHDCARKVIRALIAENSGMQTSSEVSMKLFLMLQAPMQSKAPEGFLPRWKYTYDQTKVQASTHIRLTEEARPTTSMDIEQDLGEKQMIW